MALLLLFLLALARLVFFLKATRLNATASFPFGAALSLRPTPPSRPFFARHPFVAHPL
jgi:hypothetical protein